MSEVDVSEALLNQAYHLICEVVIRLNSGQRFSDPAGSDLDRLLREWLMDYFHKIPAKVKEVL